jgi:uncharacterized protein (DUF427 family)
MTLTVGSGPFGHRPGGRFNFDVPSEGIQYLDAFPRRIRAFVGGELVVDSVNARMLYEQHRLPSWCFPPEDVRLHVLGDGAWRYEDGLAEGLIGVRWDAVDRWLEEDEEVIVHPRDPYHRIELRDTSRQVEVRLADETLAVSSAPIALFEASLPTRWYFAPGEIEAELAPNADVRTGCAYKGWASYFDVRVAGRVELALAWQYENPLEGMERIRNRICFFNERIDLIVDGELQEQPRTRWSTVEWLHDAYVDDRGARRLGLDPLGEA